jgi:hypothetical protein
MTFGCTIMAVRMFMRGIDSLRPTLKGHYKPQGMLHRGFGTGPGPFHKESECEIHYSWSVSEHINIQTVGSSLHEHTVIADGLGWSRRRREATSLL